MYMYVSCMCPSHMYMYNYCTYICVTLWTGYVGREGDSTIFEVSFILPVQFCMRYLKDQMTYLLY